MEVDCSPAGLDIPAVLAALLDECSAITDYRTLRDNLPRRLAGLLRCRYVLLYQRIGETLQFAAGNFADQPGWSAALLAVAQINPIELTSDLPETQAWRARRAITADLADRERAQVCAPLIYRQHAIGVLTAIRGAFDEATDQKGEEQRAAARGGSWSPEEVALVEVAANVAAMLLENTRLLERDRERIHELSLLNAITSQLNSSLHEPERVHRIVVQRVREISAADLCEVLLPVSPPAAVSWIPRELQEMLLQRWLNDLRYTPLLLERASESQGGAYMAYLAPSIKTFFALPLIGQRGGSQVRETLASHAPRRNEEQGIQVLGVIVGAYQKPWKLRREELALLQILAGQASATLENIALMNDVIAARNEARRLLRQVLDDQRLKELILESIPSGLITSDRDGLITTFNRAAAAMLGYHPREVIGRPVLKVLNLRHLDRVLQTGQPQHETLLTGGSQGQDLALDVTLVPLRDDQGQQMGVLATFADITAMYQLEEEKRRLDHLASLGEMSASVAHEVRNPLASIKTSIQMLRDDLEEQAAFQANAGTQGEIAVILKEIERLDSIVRNLLLFARPQRLHLTECDLIELSKRLLRFIQPQLDERGVHVHLVQQEAPAVSVDVAQMEQVLTNLFLNALQAMPDGGILTVSCQVAQQKWLELTVSDTGVGMSQDMLARIFQPFYTTKAHGIGLGLPITRRLIEDHRGSILVESQLGYGTTVIVRLPLDAQASQEQGVGEGEVHREFDHLDC